MPPLNSRAPRLVCNVGLYSLHLRVHHQLLTLSRYKLELLLFFSYLFFSIFSVSTYGLFKNSILIQISYNFRVQYSQQSLLLRFIHFIVTAYSVKTYFGKTHCWKRFISFPNMAESIILVGNKFLEVTKLCPYLYLYKHRGIHSWGVTERLLSHDNIMLSWTLGPR